MVKRKKSSYLRKGRLSVFVSQKLEMLKCVHMKNDCIQQAKGYDFALSVSTREYAEMSCASVWTSLVFCLLERKRKKLQCCKKKELPQ